MAVLCITSMLVFVCLVGWVSPNRFAQPARVDGPAHPSFPSPPCTGHAKSLSVAFYLAAANTVCYFILFLAWCWKVWPLLRSGK